VVAVAVVSLLLLVWYPGPLYEAGGGERLTFILVAIDIVAGPILTLLVFRSGKPGMKFDLAIIAMLQAAFLAYGLWVISAARPAYVVFVADRFVAVGANQLADERLAEAPRGVLAPPLDRSGLGWRQEPGRSGGYRAGPAQLCGR